MSGQGHAWRTTKRESEPRCEGRCAQAGYLLPCKGCNSAFGRAHCPILLNPFGKPIACGAPWLTGTPLSATIHVAPEFIWEISAKNREEYHARRREKLFRQRREGAY